MRSMKEGTEGEVDSKCYAMSFRTRSELNRKHVERRLNCSLLVKFVNQVLKIIFFFLSFCYIFVFMYVCTTV